MLARLRPRGCLAASPRVITPQPSPSTPQCAACHHHRHHPGIPVPPTRAQPGAPLPAAPLQRRAAPLSPAHRLRHAPSSVGTTGAAVGQPHAQPPCPVGSPGRPLSRGGSAGATRSGACPVGAHRPSPRRAASRPSLPQTPTASASQLRATPRGTPHHPSTSSAARHGGGPAAPCQPPSHQCQAGTALPPPRRRRHQLRSAARTPMASAAGYVPPSLGMARQDRRGLESCCLQPHRALVWGHSQLGGHQRSPGMGSPASPPSSQRHCATYRTFCSWWW